MPRTVKPKEHAAKRGAILDTAHRLVLTKGYEQVSIQDILDELQISGGAFHHYFDSRGALLEALIERIQEGTEKPLRSIVDDPRLTAIQKLQGFFATLDRLRVAHQEEVVELARVWYGDGNALVRQKVDEAIRRQRAPLLTAIVRQGIREGVFTTAFPDQAGAIVHVLVQGMENTHARMLLAITEGSDAPAEVAGIVATHAAYLDAIERVLGAPANSFDRADAGAVMRWVTALRKSF